MQSSHGCVICRGGDLTDISQGRAEKNDEQISKVEQQQECHNIISFFWVYFTQIYWYIGKNVFPVPKVWPFW